MLIKSIQLNNFRNIRSQNIELGKQINVFFGLNGHGKTSLLEAIYLLSRGESFRQARNSDLISKQLAENHIDTCRIKSIIAHDRLETEVAMELSGSRKSAFYNKKKVSSQVLNRQIPTVFFSPESLDSIKHGPDHRRSLLDELYLISGATAGVDLKAYAKVLKTRNRVLSDHRDKRFQLHETRELLEALNPEFLRLASIITAGRLRSLQEFLPQYEMALADLLGGSSAKVKISYLMSKQTVTTLSEKELSNIMLGRMNELEAAELALGSSLVGPHKHDVKFLFDDEDSRYFCSQGQQRCLILAFKMAEVLWHYAKHVTYPILLLDDVLSELDTLKHLNLINFLSKIDSQILITTTDPSFKEELRRRGYPSFLVTNGEINRA